MDSPVSFSSNVQVNFSDYLSSVIRLSVRMFVNFSHFDFSRTIGPNLTKLYGKGNSQLFKYRTTVFLKIYNPDRVKRVQFFF